ncbi:hypothetical protein BLD25_03570 [Candidatus Gracilibacteria bacterium GN02-872]|nr:hypothetical protein BLD25_03570 [Candidatus Gracilibacteria bacterium GN02-872]
MKIGFAGKGGAGKTTLSSLIIKKLSEKYKILALDLDSNVNLVSSLGLKNTKNMKYFGPKKDEIMAYTGSTQMDDWENRIFLPKETDGFYNLENKFIKENSLTEGKITAMSLGFIEDEKRGIESMCDYYEMSKVFMNHIKLKKDEILVADLAAGIEMISRATIMSFDLIFVVTDANFKNIKVARQIINGLEMIDFKKDEFFIIPNKYLDDEDLEIIQNNFSKYNILPGIAFSEEIYDLDSEKKLHLGDIVELDKAIDKIAEKIIEIKNFKRNVEKRIENRIKFLDEKKAKFLA